MGLSVRLAGYNIDADLIGEVVELIRSLDSAASRSATLAPGDCRELLESVAARISTHIATDSFTPETISAAYARISRDPQPVTELRRAARFAVARARKSNDNIIFGLGHASVAEHACFNLDILGLSRLASEELQSHRLVSFTEKSQRYITISSDFAVPSEIVGTPWEARFKDAIPRLFQAYGQINEALAARYRAELLGEPTKPQIRDLETRAKEDARYLLPLACTTQMGMTLNARNIEHIARDLSDHPLKELRDLGEAMRQAVTGLAPSLVKYVSRGVYPRKNRKALSDMLGGVHDKRISEFRQEPRACLVASTPNGEDRILTALLFSMGGYSHAGEPRNLAEIEKQRIWQTLFENMTAHDGALRELEVASLVFEAEISASCFAQLKRHRMITLLSQPYSPNDGAIVPPSIAEAGLKADFQAVIQEATGFAAKFAQEFPELAAYALTNAHIKRVLIQINAREMYHFARLRCDSHAQWEVRSLAHGLMKLAKREWPNAMALAVGKDEFEAEYGKRYL